MGWGRVKWNSGCSWEAINKKQKVSSECRMKEQRDLKHEAEAMLSSLLHSVSKKRVTDPSRFKGKRLQPHRKLNSLETAPYTHCLRARVPHRSLFIALHAALSFACVSVSPRRLSFMRSRGHAGPALNEASPPHSFSHPGARKRREDCPKQTLWMPALKRHLLDLTGPLCSRTPSSWGRLHRTYTRSSLRRAWQGWESSPRVSP